MATINETKKTVKGVIKKGKTTKELEKAIKEPIIAKTITVDPNGVDIRQLSEQDLNQIMFDSISNIQLYSKHHQMSLTNVELLLTDIVTKMYGEDADKVIGRMVEKKLSRLHLKEQNKA